MKKKPLLFCLAILINGLVLNAQVFNILPYPNKLEIGKGYFDLNTTIQIVNTIKDPMVTPTIGILKEHLKSLQETIDKTKQPIINVNFTDSENNYSLTNKAKNYSFYVLKGVKIAIIRSLHERMGTVPDVLFFYFLKKEQRKFELFKRLFADCFPQLINSYIDKNSSAKYDLAYFWKKS